MKKKGRRVCIHTYIVLIYFFKETERQRITLYIRSVYRQYTIIQNLNYVEDVEVNFTHARDTHTHTQTHYIFSCLQASRKYF